MKDILSFLALLTFKRFKRFKRFGVKDIESLSLPINSLYKYRSTSMAKALGSLVMCIITSPVLSRMASAAEFEEESEVFNELSI